MSTSTSPPSSPPAATPAPLPSSTPPPDAASPSLSSGARCPPSPPPSRPVWASSRAMWSSSLPTLSTSCGRPPVMSISAVLITTNSLNTLGEIAKQIADSNPVLVFTTHTLLPKLRGNGFPIMLLKGKVIGGEDSRIVCSIQELVRSEPDEKHWKERISQDDTATLGFPNHWFPTRCHWDLHSEFGVVEDGEHC